MHKDDLTNDEVTFLAMFRELKAHKYGNLEFRLENKEKDHSASLVLTEQLRIKKAQRSPLDSVSEDEAAIIKRFRKLKSHGHGRIRVEMKSGGTECLVHLDRADSVGM